ncbi:MAG: DNA topoisomerase 3 [Peptoniphilaceae bacterium]
MKLIIAEKPSVARSIARVIGANQIKEGYLEGNDYLVSWCVGHLVGLDDAEAYDSRFKKWEIQDLPILPSNWKTKVFSKTSKQFNILNKLMNDPKVEEIICGTDSGREGELIFRLVYEKVNCKKAIKRLWISSMEEVSIKKGLENLKDGKEFEALYKSALARSQADWIVGINSTRLFSTLYNTLLSVGRVQTPTLTMIVNRENEIERFQVKDFYKAVLYLDHFEIETTSFDNKEEALKVFNSISDNQIKCVELMKKEKKTKAPLPYDLTTLQREANRYFSYTAKQTLDYAQDLYENKWITYPRTDSRYLTDDMGDSLKIVLKSFNEDRTFDQMDISRIINNKKVSDHHAIIPTHESLIMDSKNLPKTNQNIFNLILMRFVTSVLSDCVEEKVKAEFEKADHKFFYKATSIRDEGYKNVENRYLKKLVNNKKEGNELVEINKGSIYSIKDKKVKTGKTSPPKRFTEDTLLLAMERAGNEDLDKDLDTEKSGIGTPATRASMIEKLIKVGYIERKNKNLHPTHKAFNLVTILPKTLKSPKITAQWENKLTEISNSNYSSERFLNEIENFIKDIILDYSSVVKNNPFENVREIGKCPRCQLSIYEGKKNYYCINKDCNFVLFKEDRFFTKKRKKLTKKMVQDLLGQGSTYIKDLYSEKKKKTYNAHISIEDTGKYINYKMEFDKK